MARVVVLAADLMFSSRLAEALSAAGHQVTPVARGEDARRALGGADVLVADVADPSLDVAALVSEGRSAASPGTVRTVGFYPHVDVGARERALAAGVGLVVPRSRMAREAAALVEKVLGPAP